jgi:hypothetical protein
MARTKKYTPEETLRSLYNLQFIDSRIDTMREVRGELPMEVSDLEDEMVGLTKRLEKIEEQTGDLNQLILEKKNIIEESKLTVKKYLEKQKNVRNNREFDSLSKEIEYQELEAELAEKRIKENSARIDGKKEVLDEVEGLLKAKEEALEAKNNELKEIISETEREEKILIEESEKASKSIEERFLTAYKRIRGASKKWISCCSC